jgi:hypothetical protein
MNSMLQLFISTNLRQICLATKTKNYQILCRRTSNHSYRINKDSVREFWILPIVGYYKERNFPESESVSTRGPQNRTLLLSWELKKELTSILGPEEVPPIPSPED